MAFLLARMSPESSVVAESARTSDRGGGCAGDPCGGAVRDTACRSGRMTVFSVAVESCADEWLRALDAALTDSCADR